MSDTVSAGAPAMCALATAQLPHLGDRAECRIVLSGYPFDDEPALRRFFTQAAGSHASAREGNLRGRGQAQRRVVC
jgi:hypothetical protein